MKVKLFKVNPLNWFRGIIKFPLGFYKYDKCDCRTCQSEGPGWGFMALFLGISFSKE